MNPRILVISIYPWSKTIGNDTFISIIGKYNPENLACICVRDYEPDFSICNNYFCISESLVFKSIIKKSLKTGYKIKPSLKNNQKDTKRYKKRSKILYYSKMLFREFLWKIGNWETKEFEDFVLKFNPDIILYEMSRYPHLNRIAEKTISISHAKGIGYFVDDTFTYKQDIGLGFYLFRFFQRKSLKKLVNNSSAFFAIASKTKKEADSYFGINCQILTKPLFVHSFPLYKEYSCDNISIIYTGNLGIGRLNTLLLVSKYCKLLSKSINISIYSNTFLNLKEKRKLNKYGVTLNEPIDQDSVKIVQGSSDILLFLESLSRFKKTARLSFSTKLVEYLSCGKPIWAVGNKDLSPIYYFKENNSAYVSTSKKEIKETINAILKKDRLLTIIGNSRSNAKIYHSKEKIKKVFWDKICEVIE